MATDLVLADPAVLDQATDPGAFVVTACERAKAWLEEALEHGQMEQIAELRSQAEAVRVYTVQRQLGRDAQLAAAEVVRRAERGIGVAIRRGQQAGEIAKPGDRGGRGAPGVRGGNPGDARGDHLGRAAEFFRNGKERAGTYAMTDGVSDTQFEHALREAQAEGNLSRANVVRKIRRHATTRHGVQPPRAQPAPAGHLRPPGRGEPRIHRGGQSAEQRRELIADLASHGMTSRQIAARLGIRDQRVRQLAREHGITIRADAVVGRTRRLDSTRIAREAVHALEGLAMSVQLADLSEIDPAQVPEWTGSLTRSLRVLSRFARQLKEVSHEQ